MSEPKAPYRSTSKPATPRVDLLAALLEIYTEEQLVQFVRLSRQAQEESGINPSSAGVYADVTVRFKLKLPRFIGIHLWEETAK